jgi:hypothetical protein
MLLFFHPSGRQLSGQKRPIKINPKAGFPVIKRYIFDRRGGPAVPALTIVAIGDRHLITVFELLVADYSKT